MLEQILHVKLALFCEKVTAVCCRILIFKVLQKYWCVSSPISMTKDSLMAVKFSDTEPGIGSLLVAAIASYKVNKVSDTYNMVYILVYGYM